MINIDKITRSLLITLLLNALILIIMSIISYILDISTTSDLISLIVVIIGLSMIIQLNYMRVENIA